MEYVKRLSWAGLVSAGLIALVGGCRSQSSPNAAGTSGGGGIAQAAPTPAPAPAPAMTPLTVYVGTYTGPNSKGIYQYQFDPRTGALTPQGLAGETTNPSWLIVHPNRHWLFAVNEVGDVNGKKGGGVTGFMIDPATGKLTAINQQPSGGESPCHLAIDPAGTHVLVANYGGGNVEVLPVDATGRLGEPTCLVQHRPMAPLSQPTTDATTGTPATGPATEPVKERHANAHWIGFDPARRFAIACDLGLDQVLVYDYDPERGTLSPHDPPASTVAQGTGPRHLVFGPGGRFAYVLGELGGTVTVFAWDPALATLRQVQSITSLPEGYTGRNNSAEIMIHPNGRFLYASNRGPDDIAIYAIDPLNGRLTPVGRVGTHGKSPRGVALDPSGNYLIAGNQNSDNLVVFKVDPNTGALTPTGTEVQAPSPVSVIFFRPGGAM